MKYIYTKLNEFCESLSSEYENVILFHGSNKEFDEFSDDLIGTGDGGELFGSGYYLTNNPDIAKVYAIAKTKSEKITKYTPTGIFGSEVPHFTNDADEYANNNFVINKFRVHGRILNVDEFVIDKKFEKYLIDVTTMHDLFPENVSKILNYCRENREKIKKFRGELEYIIRQCIMGDNKALGDVMMYIKNLGYDGIKYKSDTSYELHDSWNYVIFNKKCLSKLN